MIRIDKSGPVPDILGDPHGKGAVEAASLCERYDNGERDFEFNSRIYGHKSVKERLVQVQHGKCFLCESAFQHVSYGDVEHFRPKGGFQQEESEPITQPGYYWLAYDWSNLFLSCQICNQRHKKNLFPLADPSKRGLSHHADIKREQSLLIDPSTENPEEYVTFRDEVAVPVDGPGKARAEATIEIAGLNRQLLLEQRFEHVRQLKLLVNAYEQLMLIEARGEATTEQKNILAELRDAFRRLMQPESEYSAMAKATLKETYS